MRVRRLGIDATWLWLGVLFISLFAGFVAFCVMDPPASRGSRGPEAAGRDERRGTAAPAPERPGAERGGAILVEVLLHGRPVRAEVEIRPRGEGDAALPPRGPAVFAAGAWGDGRALFAPAPPGCYEILARDAGGRTGATTVWVDPPGARVLARIELPGGEHVLRGRAMRADGTAFRGNVNAFTSRFGAGEPAIDFQTAPAETDAEGRFAIPGLFEGQVWLRAAGPDGLVSRAGPFRVPNAAEVRFVVDEGASDFTGRVLDAADDRPVAGAEVRFGGGKQARSAEWSTRADGSGAFRLRRLPGDGRLEVSAPGFTRGRLSVPADRTAADIRISRVAVVRGIVLDATDGTPLPGIPVRASAGTRVWSFPVTRTVSGPDGRFELPLGGAGLVRGLAAGAGRASAVMEVESAPGAGVEVRLLAGLAAGLAGAVLDETGGGLAGVPVWAWSRGIGEWETVTAEDGTFAFDALPPREGLTLYASPAGRAEVEAEVRTGRPGETVRVEMRALVCRVVEATVVEEETGAPIPGAAVSLVASTATSPRHGTVTGPDGVARFAAVPAARLSMEVEAGRHWLAVPLPDLPASTADASLRVVLRPGLSIAGRVRRPGGEPAAGAPVRAQREQDADEPGPWEAETVADEAGGFRLGPLMPGEYDVLAWKLGETGQASACAGSMEVIVEITGPEEAGGEPLEFLVLDGDDRPVPSALVLLFDVSVGLRRREVPVVDGRGPPGCGGGRGLCLGGRRRPGRERPAPAPGSCHRGTGAGAGRGDRAAAAGADHPGPRPRARRIAGAGPAGPGLARAGLRGDPEDGHRLRWTLRVPGPRGPRVRRGRTGSAGVRSGRRGDLGPRVPAPRGGGDGRARAGPGQASGGRGGLPRIR
ncbi:MAG: carboxypeptidase-like regulatory domain-containing protein [Planctomycetes bacterium]|jgi:hypothetical protein|nr:carboxypeptidase-like regulatory domain-containing protein [Planctomycetota bacterium]